MSKTDEYLRLAAECDKVARAVSPLSAKAECRAMARTYRRLADQAAQRDGAADPKDSDQGRARLPDGTAFFTTR